MLNRISGSTDNILDYLGKVWEIIKKIFVEIINLFENIDKWFSSKYDEVIKKSPLAKPVAVKIDEAIKSGKYASRGISNLGKKHQIVNTFYDPITKTLSEDYTEVIASDAIDNDTLEAFGDDDVLIYE